MRPPRGSSAAFRRTWRTKVAELDTMGMAETADPSVVEQWVRWRLIADEAFADIAERGHVVGGRSGTRVKNPSVSTLAQASAELVRCDKALGVYRPQDRKKRLRRLRIVDPQRYLNGGDAS